MAAGDHQPPPRPAGLVVRPLTSGDSEDISGWQYDGPWRIYDSSPDGTITAESGYQAVADSATGALVGHICLGGEARVPGNGPEAGSPDVGALLGYALLAAVAPARVVGLEGGILEVGAGRRPLRVGSRIGTEFGATV